MSADRQPNRDAPPNLLVLGTGRSGTSMVTGMFTETHYCGDDYITVREANPTGFNEDSRVNRINDVLMWWHWSICLPAKLGLPGCAPHRDRRGLWMASPLSDFHRGLRSAERDQMAECLARQPFCYKDPRFSYTLRFWEPRLPPGTLKLVVFRSRERTVASMMRECRESYDPPIRVTEEWLRRHWTSTYERLLSEATADRSGWMFVDYTEVLSGAAIPAIEAFVGVTLRTSHINRSVSRTAEPADAMNDHGGLYGRLRRAACEDRRRLVPTGELDAARG